MSACRWRFAAFMAAALKAPPTVTRTLLFLTALCFAVGVALGTYHAGAEWGWWAGPSDCGGGTGNTTSAGDLLGKLNNIHVIRCDQASWRLPNVPWGLSFAGWNAVISLVLVVIALWGGLAAAARRQGVSGSRLQLGIPVEIVDPGIVQIVRRKQPAVIVQRRDRGLIGHLRRPHTRLARMLAALPQIACRTGGDDIVPCRLAAACLGIR